MGNQQLQPGQVNIHGKVYDTVARRIQMMRNDDQDYRIETEVLSQNEFRVLMKATLYDAEGNIIATGHAEEDRAKDNLNEDSAIEVCETSAVGRCLGLAYWPGSETNPQIASGDEVALAIKKEQEKYYGQYMAKVFEHWESIVAIKAFLLEDNIDAAREAYNELGHDDMVALWKAPTKGGIFTVEERRKLKEGYGATPQEV